MLKMLLSKIRDLGKRLRIFRKTRSPSLWIPPPYSYLKVFISHARESKAEAEYYADLLRRLTFEVFLYEHAMLPGENADMRSINERLKETINQCDYFFLLVCDHSICPDRPWCAMELGLALQIQKERLKKEEERSCEPFPRPVIIPVYSKNWRRHEGSGCPKQFPVRDFLTGELKEPYVFHLGHDPHGSNPARTDSDLMELMRPRLCRGRREITSERQFQHSRVLNLYKTLFPDEDDRDSNEDIMEWVLNLENGQCLPIILPFPDRPNFKETYQLDALFYYVTLYGNSPIALCYLNYHPESQLIAGHYFAVGSGWRAFGLAKKFREAMETDILAKYPKARGVLFEIEPVDFYLLEDFLTISTRNCTCNRITLSSSSPIYDEIRRLKRLVFYQQSLRAKIYMDRDRKVPLICDAPCYDIERPQAEWRNTNVKHWLMWYSQNNSNAPTWEEAVKFYYIEVHTKGSIYHYQNDLGAEYWTYVTGVVNNNISNINNKNVTIDIKPVRDIAKKLARVVNNYDEIAI